MKDITVVELKKRLDNEEDLFVIDVREIHEYDEFNIGAENIPLGLMMTSIDDLEDYKEEEIVVHCRSGRRSEAAKQMLEQHGFKKVRNLLGGLEEWKSKFA